MDGLLIIDKPAGLTSHDVVAHVRRILQERRVGHTGTLDPFATGVLVVLVGRATRLAQFLSGAEKEYQALIRLGYATDTGDLTGKPTPDTHDGAIARSPFSATDQEIERALESLRGEIDQLPPMYSAKKHNGRKLYELARRGEQIERKTVRVTVNVFETVGGDGPLLRNNEDGTVDLAVRVVCSAGTYVRTLAEAVGERLGVGAHLAELRRTRAGDFHISQARTLEHRLGAVADLSKAALLPPDSALHRMPFVHLSASEVRRACQGMAIPLTELGSISTDGETVRMRDEQGNLIAVGSYEAAGQMLHPRVVIVAEK
ncbi:MAG: tRNA pseudouridine(55) synthase TruB [Pyrinomonadaceae bacterium]